MNNRIHGLVAALGSLGACNTVQASLIDAGNGLINNTTQHLVWTQDANLAATETFGVAGIEADGRMTGDLA